MPPSVARTQLPNGNAHATKEPLGKAGLNAFSDGCCTNNTQPAVNFRSKSLFYIYFFGETNSALYRSAFNTHGSFPLPESFTRENRRTDLRIHDGDAPRAKCYQHYCRARSRADLLGGHTLICAHRPRLLPRFLWFPRRPRTHQKSAIFRHKMNSCRYECRP